MRAFLKEYGDGIALLFFIFVFAFCIGKLAEIETKEKYEKSNLFFEKLVGNTAENLTAIKRECEKDLPRNRECVLIYDYVPVDKE